jgi:transposase
VTEREALIVEAKRLRAEEGWSCQRIADQLGVSRTTVREWLAGVPVPEWTKRPNAKDELREQAMALRVQGWSVNDIAVELGVARSTAWNWVRHLPLDPDTERARHKREHARIMTDARWREHRTDRDARRVERQQRGSELVNGLTPRDLMLLGAVVYWCEGSKTKPWRDHVTVTFVNSDPLLIKVFMSFLRIVGIPADRLEFRIQIHETADVSAALAWWSDQVGVPAQAFRRTTLKRHRPTTNRRNVGDSYHGCLSVSVRKGRELYWWIEGVIQAIPGALASTQIPPDVGIFGSG